MIAPGDVIDNMEAGTGSILSQGGRIGSWYTYNDGTTSGMQTPLAGGMFAPELIPGGHGTSTKAARTHGMGFTTWGAGMGFDLHNTGTTKSAYDVSAFKGVAFWAKGEPGTIRFKALTSATVAFAEGGLCTAVCGDSHGAIVPLTSDWVQITIPFTSLTQEGWGTQEDWNPMQVLSIQFQSGAVPFDFWVDDIGFY
ncbi:Hypothetical protein A7982_11131 [Minicystis rosea]|nr:Hypothetical protein A7982_11131 [Minicystis rosea]